MEFTINTKEFTAALKSVLPVIDKKSVFNMLRCVALDVSDNELKITGTDSKTTITVSRPCMAVGMGSIGVLAKDLYDAVKNITDENIHITVFDNDNAKGLQVESIDHSITRRLDGYHVDLFPSPPISGSPILESMPADLLRVMFNRVEYARSTDISRSGLCGVHCESTPEGLLRLVAVDGHRLAYTEFATPGLVLGLPAKGATIPNRAIDALLPLLSKAARSNIEIGFSASHTVFRLNSVVIVAAHTDTDFPIYQPLVSPNPSDIHIELDRQTLIAALKKLRPTLVSIQKAKAAIQTKKDRHKNGYPYQPGVIFEFQSQSKQLDLKIESEFGSGTASLPFFVELPIESDESFRMGFNADYMLDALGSLNSNRVCICLKDSFNPVILTSPNEAGHEAWVMPMVV